MNATPYLNELARWFSILKLDAVMIGNAAAVVHGAPVTTLDVDFMIEHTDENYRKLAFLAQQLNCQFIEMKLPGDNYMYRLKHRDDLVLLDFMYAAAGIKSFEAVKQNGTVVLFGEHPLTVASLEDILASKRAAGRPKDMMSIPMLELTLNEKRKQ